MEVTMLVRARRCALFASLALLVSACSGGATGTSTPLAPSQPDTAGAAFAAADEAALSPTIREALDSAPIVTGGRAAFHPLSFRPNAAAPAFLMSWVAAGESQGGVPCFDCVNGAQTGDNMGLTGAGNYVPSDATSWQYALAYTNMSFKGKCTLSWAITSGKKTVDKFSVPLTLPESGGFVLYGINRNRPKFSGTAVLTGQVKCGKAPAQSSKANMIFQ
jgi:hypothetical protein